MAVFFKKALGFCILLIPHLFLTQLYPVFPFHSNFIEPLDLVFGQMFSRAVPNVDLSLFIEPFVQPYTLSFIIWRNTEISMLSIIGTY